MGTRCCELSCAPNLDWVDSFLYLEISISKNLLWSSQCEHAAATGNRVLGILKHIMKGAPQGTKLQAYLMLVCPHLEYCILPITKRTEKLWKECNVVLLI